MDVIAAIKARMKEFSSEIPEVSENTSIEEIADFCFKHGTDLYSFFQPDVFRNLG